MDEKKAKMIQVRSELVQEKDELEEKLNQLNDFNQGDQPDSLTPTDKAILLIQAGAMYTYLECLKARLERM